MVFNEADGIHSALDLPGWRCVFSSVIFSSLKKHQSSTSTLVCFLPYLPSSDSPMLKNLTVAILQLSESGELTYLHDKWWPNNCMEGQDAHSASALGLKNLLGLFLLLGLGLGLGLLIALLELLSKARGLAKDGKVMVTVLGGDRFQVQKERRKKLPPLIYRAITQPFISHSIVAAHVEASTQLNQLASWHRDHPSTTPGGQI